MKKYKIIEPKSLSGEELNARKDFTALMDAYRSGLGNGRRWMLTFPALAAAAAIAMMFVFRPAQDTAGPPEDVVAQTIRTVSPPAQNIDIPYRTYTINPSETSKISIEEGTQIHIPARAFVDIHGVEIETEVEVSYREFHNPIQFLLSGIPMVFDSVTGEFQFISAGMFDIQTRTEGEDVYLKPEARIDIDFVSGIEGDEYSFYRFDTEEGKWITVMSGVEALTMDVGQELPGEEADAVTTAMQQVTASDQNDTPPAPVAPRRITDSRKVFKFVVDKDRFPELNGYTSGYFEVLDVDFDSRLFSLNWESASLDPPVTKGQAYKLHLGRKDTMIHVDVHPVLEESEFAAAWEKYREELSNHNTMVKRRMETGRRAAVKPVSTNVDGQPRTLKVTRSVAISAPGIYNFDKPVRIANLLAQQAVPVFMDARRNPVKVRMAYLIDRTINTYFTFFNLDEFRWNEKNETMVWVEDMEGNLLIAELLPQDGNAKKEALFTVGRPVDSSGMAELEAAFGKQLP